MSFRRIGREYNQMREPELQKCISSSSQGSSRLKLGGTEVVVTITGPTAQKNPSDNYNTLEVRCKTSPKLPHMNSICSDVISYCIDKTEYKGSVLEVWVSIISDDGSSLSCAINCIYFALKDTGLVLKHSIFSSSFVIQGGAIFYDPSLSEELSSNTVAQVTFVFNEQKEVVNTLFYGFVDQENFNKLLNLATVSYDVWNNL